MINVIVITITITILIFSAIEYYVEKKQVWNPESCFKKSIVREMEKVKLMYGEYLREEK